MLFFWNIYVKICCYIQDEVLFLRKYETTLLQRLKPTTNYWLSQNESKSEKKT